MVGMADVRGGKYPGWQMSWVEDVRGGRCSEVADVGGWQMSGVADLRGGRCPGWQMFGVADVRGWQMFGGGRCPG